MLHTHTACDEVDVEGGGGGGGSARLQTHEHTHTAYDEVDVGGVVPDYKYVNIHTLHVTIFTHSLYCER